MKPKEENTEGNFEQPVSAQEDYLDELGNLLIDDPLAADDNSQSPQSSEEPSTEGQEQQQQPAAVSNPETQEAPQSEQQQPSNIEGQLNQLMQMIAAQQQQQPQPQQQAPQQEQGPEQIQYNVPDQLLHHLRSEDPNEVRTGVNALLVGLTQTVEKRFNERLAEVEQQVFQRATQSTQQAQLTQQVNTDFYSKNPDLAEARPIVAQTYKELAMQGAVQGWNPQVADVVAQRVRQKLAQWAGVQNPPQANQQAAKPPAVVGSGNRPSTGPKLTPQDALLADTMKL